MKNKCKICGGFKYYKDKTGVWNRCPRCYDANHKLHIVDFNPPRHKKLVEFLKKKTIN